MSDQFDMLAGQWDAVDASAAVSDFSFAPSGGDSFLSGAKDWIGTALGAWTAVEKTKQATRLQESQLQAQQWELAARYQNPQASGIRYGLPAGTNPLLLGALILVAGFVVWKLAR